MLIGPMLGMRISVQEYAAAFAELIVKISVNALVTLTRWMNDAFMAFPFVVFRRRCNAAVTALQRRMRRMPACHNLERLCHQCGAASRGCGKFNEHAPALVDFQHPNKLVRYSLRVPRARLRVPQCSRECSNWSNKLCRAPSPARLERYPDGSSRLRLVPSGAWVRRFCASALISESIVAQSAIGHPP